jgi:phenylalanyl-tRNA synthetase beta subunit
VEEVAIGYGIDNIKPTIPSFLISSGRRNEYFKKFDEINPTMVIVSMVTRKPIPGVLNLKMLSILLKIA